MATVTITRGNTLPDSSAKADFHALVDDATGGVSAIVNADIDAAAAIAPTKLAEITTAGKVDGSALHDLADTPWGDSNDVLPNKNTVGGAIEVVFDNTGVALEAGSHIELMAPKAITITGAYAFADVSGSIEVDIWKDTIANYPPTVADTIVASAPVTITTDTDSTDTTLTGWTTSVTALDVLKFYINSCTTITKCTIVLTFDRA